MISITKEELDIEETLKKKIKNTLSFLGIKGKVKAKISNGYFKFSSPTIGSSAYLTTDINGGNNGMAERKKLFIKILKEVEKRDGFK